METQLYSMRQKAHVLQTLGQPLEDSLIAVAMILSLPASYSILHTILMSSGDRLTVESVIAQVLVEEKARKGPSQTALAAKTTQPCKKSGHTEDECWKKKADKATKGMESGNKERPLRLFVAKRSKASLSTHEWIIDTHSRPHSVSSLAMATTSLR